MKYANNYNLPEGAAYNPSAPYNQDDSVARYGSINAHQFSSAEINLLQDVLNEDGMDADESMILADVYKKITKAPVYVDMYDENNQFIETVKV
jgi:hypothetical protein